MAKHYLSHLIIRHITGIRLSKRGTGIDLTTNCNQKQSGA